MMMKIGDTGWILIRAKRKLGSSGRIYVHVYAKHTISRCDSTNTTNSYIDQKEAAAIKADGHTAVCPGCRAEIPKIVLGHVAFQTAMNGGME